VPAGRRGGQVARAEPPARGHQGLPGAEVLACRPHVPPARRVARSLSVPWPTPTPGGGNDNAAVRLRQQALPHDHAVRARRHRVAGVDPLEQAGRQSHRLAVGRVVTRLAVGRVVTRLTIGGSDGACRGEVGRAHRDHRPSPRSRCAATATGPRPARW